MPRDRSLSESQARLCRIPRCRRYAKEANTCLLHFRESTDLFRPLYKLASSALLRIHDAEIATTPFADRPNYSWSEPCMDPIRDRLMPIAPLTNNAKSNENKHVQRNVNLSPETGPVNRNARCRVATCTSYARNGGCCTRHGGGRKCLMDNCSTPSQTGGLCRLHGGGTRCKIEGCTKFARVRGLCSIHFRSEESSGQHVKRKGRPRTRPSA
ncbi:hypothetical protein THRCLA_21346 [Thraustotheca clavata]|uniref:WRKY19-like zinc finger domain-containing protein n=1 Tax=Thraustotheca clavata TaxID=74557 RepID=A0A1V9ZXH7_9STRA|nr:hypothetical protein THRCLA_21346 [Thraustotheca clavata]